MPAIQPARLRQQVVLLNGHFHEPAVYVRKLHHLLDSYADRAYRRGQAGKPSPLLKAYNVRAPVLRGVLHGLVPLALSDPEAGFQLCDALWAEPFLEFKLLAVSLLGQLPALPEERILDRVRAWLKPDVEEQLAFALLSRGLHRINQENPDAIIGLAEGWLDSPQIFLQQMGLRSLISLTDEASFQNLPIIFRLIFPFVHEAPSALRADLLDLLSTLARRSPRESAYFLRQTIEMTQSRETAWLIRNSLRDFPPEIQESLREVIREI